jgi:hypothetical protein
VVAGQRCAVVSPPTAGEGGQKMNNNRLSGEFWFRDTA